jgi:formylmethanofuran dehydrogenase subunit E
MFENAELCEICGNYVIEYTVTEVGDLVCTDCLKDELIQKELNDSID